jgi:hypothetical protein
LSSGTVARDEMSDGRWRDHTAHFLRRRSAAKKSALLPPETPIARAARVVSAKSHFIAEQVRTLEMQMLTLDEASLRQDWRASQLLSEEFETLEAYDQKAVDDASATFHLLSSALFPRIHEARQTLVSATAANVAEAQVQRCALTLATQLLQEQMPHFRRLSRQLMERSSNMHERASKLANSKAHQLHASAVAAGEHALGGVPLELQHAFCTEAKHFRFDNVKRMVSARPSLVNVQPCGRWSALHQAAAAHNVEAVRWLLAHGANPLSITRDGKQPSAVTSCDSCRQHLALAEERGELALLIEDVRRSLSHDVTHDPLQRCLSVSDLRTSRVSYASA